MVDQVDLRCHRIRNAIRDRECPIEGTHSSMPAMPIGGTFTVAIRKPKPPNA
jgi:hypothetical protein